MTLPITRRQALAVAAGAVGAGVLAGVPGEAWAANDFRDAISRFTGGKAPTRGRVKLDLPDIADNGSSVPMTVAVESPMSQENFVREVLVVANGNPRSGVAAFRFSPASGVAQASTRIRLAESQTVTAIARMNDGALFMDSKQVKVTIGGCGG
jgi:sulfur-oxidizing protein SoxY